MEENISERNGFTRLMCGVAMTAIGTAHLSRDSKGLGFTLIAAGAMKVAEGIFLYCPLTAVINSNVKNAVSSSFDEYMDGETLMQAFNANYQSNSTNQSGQASSSSSSSSSNSGGLAQAASQVAGAVANAAAQTPIGKAVTQAATTVTNAMSGNNASQNGTKSNNSTQSGQSSSGQSATNPS